MDHNPECENVCEFCVQCSCCRLKSCNDPLSRWHKAANGRWYCFKCKPNDPDDPECWIFGPMEGLNEAPEQIEDNQNRPSTSSDKKKTENVNIQEPSTPKNNVMLFEKSKTNKLTNRLKSGNLSLSPSTSKQLVPIAERSKSARKALSKQFERNATGEQPPKQARFTLEGLQNAFREYIKKFDVNLKEMVKTQESPTTTSETVTNETTTTQNPSSSATLEMLPFASINTTLSEISLMENASKTDGNCDASTSDDLKFKGKENKKRPKKRDD